MMKDFQLFFGDRKPMPQWRSILGTHATTTSG
jgi:hypothetical protein